jgi:serine/threonine protein phosphatase PrpC
VYAIGVFDGHCAPGYEGRDISDACKRAFTALAKKLTSATFRDPETFKAYLKENSVLIDEWLLKTQPRNAIDAGSTAAVAFYDASSNTFYSYNVGDSRVIFFETEWTPAGRKKRARHLMQSLDHKPSVPSEIERIEKAGGDVRTSKRESSVPRVGGVLALSRSFGDFALKQPENKSTGDWVTSKPQIKGPFHPRGEFFAACMSDGVTDCMSTKEVVAFMIDYAAMKPAAEHDRMNQRGPLKSACEEIVEENLQRWIGKGCDNVSICMMRVTPRGPVPTYGADDEDSGYDE